MVIKASPATQSDSTLKGSAICAYIRMYVPLKFQPPMHLYTCTYVHVRTYLEDIGQVSEVEDVVKLDSSWKECGSHLVTRESREKLR